MNYKHILFSILLLLTLGRASAKEIVTLNESQINIYLGEHLKSAISSREFSIEQVDLLKFKKCTSKIPNMGLTDSAYWFSFNAQRTTTDQLILKIDNALLDQVEIYFLVGDSLAKQSKLKESQGFLARTFKTPAYCFEIPPDLHKFKVYIKVFALEEIIVPVKIENQSGFQTATNTKNFIIGSFIGVILIMFFYNFFLFISVRDKSYGFYAMYILFVGMTQAGMRGYNLALVFSNDISIGGDLNIIFACLASIFGVLFTQRFLETKKNSPIMNKVFTGINISFLLSIIAISFNQLLSFQLMQLSTLLATITILITSYRLVFKGYKPAIYFSIAWTVLLIGVLLHLFTENGIITPSIFGTNVMVIAVILEIALLSFALANKINKLKREKEREQHEKLSALEENKRIIINQNQILETKVKEKTKELTEANHGLNKALDDLKSTQVSLVESEKMASLGQLTAGVAHEINNPINFVSSNVRPLMRDFEDINTFISNLLKKAEKEEVIPAEMVRSLHEELDIEYTQKEINDLLVGIQEGANRTAEIVKGLKNFSRLDESDFKTADIEEGLDSTLILLRSNMRGEIDLEKEYDKIPPIDCYAGKLNQVFMNLINNSIYAILNNKLKQSGSKGAIKLITKNLDSSVKIIIEDTGMGMDKETKNKLFNPFFTTKPIGEGTGLGMSITYSIVHDLHKGNIHVESEIGKGTRIELELPKNLKK